MKQEYECEEIEEVLDIENKYDEVVVTDLGETELGLPICHYNYYDNGVLVGESEDIPNSVGGYETVCLWGVDRGIE